MTAAACGGSDDAASGDDAVDPTTAAPVDTVTATTITDDDATSDDDDGGDGVAVPSGGGTAVLTLENGESFEFDGLMCTLEPQMAAGSEILFTATSYDDPGLDITQFGDAGAVTGIATIEVWDSDYETLWEANSFGDTTVELTLDGNTIRGTAAFYDGAEGSMEPVRGEVVANC